MVGNLIPPCGPGRTAGDDGGVGSSYVYPPIEGAPNVWVNDWKDESGGAPVKRNEPAGCCCWYMIGTRSE